LQLGRIWPIEIGQQGAAKTEPAGRALLRLFRNSIRRLRSWDRQNALRAPPIISNFHCGGNGGENGGAEAKTRTENITIRSSPARKGEPLAAPQAQP